MATEMKYPPILSADLKPLRVGMRVLRRYGSIQENMVIVHVNEARRKVTARIDGQASEQVVRHSLLYATKKAYWKMELAEAKKQEKFEKDNLRRARRDLVRVTRRVASIQKKLA